MAQSYAHKITTVVHLHKRLMSVPLERHGLTYAQYQVLAVAVEYPGITAKEMLNYLDTDKATLSGVLKRLETRELLSRTPNENDRRLLHIEPNDASRVICETLKSAEADLEEDVFNGLKAKEIRIFNEVINHVTENQMKQFENLDKNETS